MKTFLGVFMMLVVSGEEENVTGILGHSVLLPCTCSERDMDKEFKWQMDKPNMKLVLKHNKTTNFNGAYEGRAEIFLSENSNNCSVLLANLTEDDQGQYKCIFLSQGLYYKLLVNLDVSASYNVCQRDSASNLNGKLSVKVFRCDAKGPYSEAEIQWSLDGQLLTNSPTTHITHTKTLDAPTGLYSFTSKLTTNLTGISQPTCNVKAKGIPTIITYACETENGQFQNLEAEHAMRYRCLIIIPSMLVLGLSLVLWLRWKFPQSSPEM